MDDLDYGPVLITKGPYKEHIGYYDDTDLNADLIVYPNTPIYCRSYYVVKPSYPPLPTDCEDE